MVYGVDHNVTELQRCIAQGLANSPQKDATIRNKGGGMCGRPSPVFICYVLTAFFCPRNLLSLLISTSVLSASLFRIPNNYEEKIRKNSLDVLTAFFCRKNLVIFLIVVSAGIRRVLISHSKKKLRWRREKRKFSRCLRRLQQEQMAATDEKLSIL